MYMYIGRAGRRSSIIMQHCVAHRECNALLVLRDSHYTGRLRKALLQHTDGSPRSGATDISLGVTYRPDRVCRMRT